jgi:two-component system sensor histidine kinase ChvG
LKIGDKLPIDSTGQSDDVSERKVESDRLVSPNNSTNYSSGHSKGISPITRRILAINVLALAVLVVGLLYVGQYRQELIDSEIAALNIQAELFAAAIGEAAVGDVENNFNDPTRRGGANQFLIVDRARQIVRRLASTTRTNTQIIMANGKVLADSRLLGGPGGAVKVEELPPPKSDVAFSDQMSDGFESFLRLLLRDPSHEADFVAATKLALKGEQGKSVQSHSDGSLSLSVAVPVQRYKQVLAALTLTKDSKQIDEAVFQVRLDILKVFGIALFVTVLLSIYLARTIARPLVRLAAATEQIRKGNARHYSISDLMSKKGEIGVLATALDEMTEDLWQRMDAIERFAADVAHEIKNPLTSLRSAVETVSRVEDPEQQKKLMSIILDDIQRLDRLISDISDASRLDAELSRAKMAPVNLDGLLQTMVDLHEAAIDGHGIHLSLVREHAGELVIHGMEDRIVQVLRNLISNAVSFSPDEGSITLRVSNEDSFVKICVEDQGPGLPPGTEENIFNRFYQERPESEKFGTHSGLGLSISKQIIDVHGGTIHAENLLSEAGKVVGACFIVRLPQSTFKPE